MRAAPLPQDDSKVYIDPTPSAQNAEGVGYPLCILVVLVMGSWLCQRVALGFTLGCLVSSEARASEGRLHEGMH
jgi:hypothetical protein